MVKVSLFDVTDSDHTPVRLYHRYAHVKELDQQV